MDFGELEDKEEEVGSDDEILSKARQDPSWQDYLRRRELEQQLAEAEEEKAREQENAKKDYVDDEWQEFMLARRREWEHRRDEERKRRLQEETDPNLIFREPREMSCWEDFMKMNPDLFEPVRKSAGGENHRAAGGEYDAETEEGGEEQERETAGAEEEQQGTLPPPEPALPPRPRSPRPAGPGVLEAAGVQHPGPGAAGGAAAPRGGRAAAPAAGGRRRRGAFSRAYDGEAPSGPTVSEDAGAPESAGQVADDPTGMSPEDPTFSFVRKMIDTNRSQLEVKKKQWQAQGEWQAGVEEGAIVPYLHDVLERIEEDERLDPEREVEVVPLERLLDKLEKEENDDEELEKVKEYLPDIEKSRQETTLALSVPQQEVPLATPAIRVLQEMYPDQDLAARDALEAFEVAQLWHEPCEEGYLSAVAAKRAEAAAEEREWLAWKAKDEMKRRLRREGLTHILAPPPKNSKIGSLAPSAPSKEASSSASGSSSSSSGMARGVCGPRNAPLARTVLVDPRPPRAAPAPAASPQREELERPKRVTVTQEELERREQEKLAQEEFERQERARLSKERLERMRERRRRREAGEEC